MAQLTQKERMLLQDQLNHEQICITKYSGYASRARNPQVRKMFNEFASEEQQHYDTINNLLQGGQTATQGSSQPQGQGQGAMSNRVIFGGQMTDNQMEFVSQANSGGADGTQSGSHHAQSRRGSTNFEAGAEFNLSTSDDKSMLEDMLMTEKYISGAYDTAVFESSNAQVRQALQHIQKDEQKHGEEIFKYMQQQGMYQTQ
ncbi:MAG: spore coat protein [Bacillota bacterium]